MGAGVFSMERSCLFIPRTKRVYRKILLVHVKAYPFRFDWNPSTRQADDGDKTTDQDPGVLGDESKGDREGKDAVSRLTGVLQGRDPRTVLLTTR